MARNKSTVRNNKIASEVSISGKSSLKSYRTDVHLSNPTGQEWKIDKEIVLHATTSRVCRTKLFRLRPCFRENNVFNRELAWHTCILQISG